MRQLKFRLIAGVYLIVIVSGCATANLASLRKSGIVGSWKSEDFGTMNIYCSGAFSYKSSFGTYFPVGEVRSESHGNWIKKITDDGFIIGPMGMKYSVSEWPHSKNGAIQMTVDKRKWVLIEGYSCQ